MRILPISDKYLDYAQKTAAELKKNGILCSVDTRAEKIGFKIRETWKDKIPYMLVVGQKEEENGTVSVRSRFEGNEGEQDPAAFMEKLLKEIRTKEIRKELPEEEKKK